MENYKNESLVDVAYAVLKDIEKEDEKVSISFSELFNEVCKRAEIPTEKIDGVIASFFTNLSLDGRFVTIKNNEWGLRKNFKFDDYHNESYDLYDEDTSETAIASDNDEEDAEDKILRGEDIDEDESIDAPKNEENEDY